MQAPVKHKVWTSYTFEIPVDHIERRIHQASLVDVELVCILQVIPGPPPTEPKAAGQRLHACV